MPRRFSIAILIALTGCATPVPPPRAQPAPVRQTILPAPVAGPEDTSLFGIVLNKPFGGMGECPVSPSVFRKGELDYGLGFAESTCYKRVSPRIGSREPLNNETIYVTWSFRTAPLMAKGGSAGVILLDGVAHAVTFSTRGVSSQQSDLAQLTDKFGAPSVRNVEGMQNRMGAKYDVVTAMWTRPDGITITYAGALSRLDEGLVTATTPRGAEHRRQVRERMRPDEQKL